MKYLKAAVAKIGTGFLYGLGLCIVLGMFSWASSYYFKAKINEDFGVSEKGCRSFDSCENESGLILNITSERIDETDFILLGNVKNEGSINWRSVKVKAELFDEKGSFIDECSEYLDQQVSPGKDINFKLSCTSCSKVNLDNYHSYTVKIIDASNW